MTPNEQKLMELAQSFKDEVTIIEESFKVMKDKVATLTDQAKAKEATKNPEDLTAEFDMLEESLGNMKGVTKDLETVAPTVGASGNAQQGNSGLSGTGQLQIDPATGQPVANQSGKVSDAPPLVLSSDKNPVQPTPLAGESGPTDTHTDHMGNVQDVKEGQVAPNQQQPGQGLKLATEQAQDSTATAIDKVSKGETPIMAGTTSTDENALRTGAVVSAPDDGAVNHTGAPLTAAPEGQHVIDATTGQTVAGGTGSSPNASNAATSDNASKEGETHTGGDGK